MDRNRNGTLCMKYSGMPRSGVSHNLEERSMTAARILSAALAGAMAFTPLYLCAQPRDQAALDGRVKRFLDARAGR